MKDNLYIKAIESITAPQNLVDETVQKLNVSESKEKVIEFRKSKCKIIKFTAAAVFVLIIGINCIPFGDSPASDIEHNFVLKVDAAEINPDVFVEIGELQESGGGSGFKAIEENEDNVLGMDGTYHVIRVDRMFSPQNLNIEGENIATITYTAHNCRLAYDTEFAGLVDVDEIPEEELLKRGVVRYYNKLQWAKSCEFDYSSQRHNIDSGKWSGATPLQLEFAFDFEEGEHIMTSNDEHYIDTNPLFEENFNARSDEFSLDITANFKDGESVTKTLNFMCENTDDRGLILYAKEA